MHGMSVALPPADAAAKAAEDARDANQAAFRHAGIVGGFAAAEGWLDAGERAALLWVAPHVRGQPVLDIGVGSGRTASLLRLMTDSYVGIDYSPEMVKLCRFLHPDLAVDVGDARDLRHFPAASFGLVAFSNNGIDAVGHQERATVLGEFARVLGPGGFLVFSSLNKDGRSYGERPWQLHRPTEPLTFDAERIVHHVARAVLRPRRLAERYRRYFSLRRQSHDEATWALGPLQAHDFRLLAHFGTVGALRREVTDAGFEIDAVFADSGLAVDWTEEHSAADYFQVVAHRPAMSQ
jgi:SAM-dependent methyltransferase